MLNQRFEALVDLGTDVRRVGGFAFGLGIGAGGSALVAVGVDAAGGPRWGHRPAGSI
jgi:hypothetical protein